MEFNSLQAISTETIHRILFDESEHPMKEKELSLQQFELWLQALSYSSENSTGCFINGQLAGFILCGIREYHQELVAFQIASAVRKYYRNIGLEKDLQLHLAEVSKRKAISRIIINIPEDKTREIDLLKALDYQTCRKLESYEMHRDMLLFPGKNRYSFKKKLNKFARLNALNYQIYPPLWTNDLVSIGNDIDHYAYLSIEKHDQTLGYGFIHRETGEVPVIGVLPTARHCGLEPLLLGKLTKASNCETITIANVEANSYLSETLDNIGITPTWSSLEMQLQLQKIKA